jgi:hypothetical protein
MQHSFAGVRIHKTVASLDVLVIAHSASLPAREMKKRIPCIMVQKPTQAARAVGDWLTACPAAFSEVVLVGGVDDFRG